MVTLFMLFLVQFAIACALLAINKHQQLNLAMSTWKKSGDSTKQVIQNSAHCCGFDAKTQDLPPDSPTQMGHPSCMEVYS